MKNKKLKPKKLKIKNNKSVEKKIPKEPASNFKGFFKELKRVRWPKSSEAWRIFGISLIFVIISSLILLFITYSFTNLWTGLGVGIGA